MQLNNIRNQIIQGQNGVQSVCKEYHEKLDRFYKALEKLQDRYSQSSSTKFDKNIRFIPTDLNEIYNLIQEDENLVLKLIKNFHLDCFLLFQSCFQKSKITIQQWNQLSQYFHKDYLTCKYFFLCIEKNRKSQWTHQQDKLISQAISKPQFTNEWTDIGRQMFVVSEGKIFKKPKEIRQRWNNYLNPNILKDKWSIDEDLVLFRVFAKEGRKWALISKILKTRSQHSVKNRYTNLFKKYKTQQISSNRLKKSQLQLQFIRTTLKKLEEDKNYTGQKISKQQYNNEYNQKNINDNHTPTFEETRTPPIKQKLQEQNAQKSVDLQFIKYPAIFEENCDDFMSNDNLIKSFQPSYHLYLF